MVPAWTETCWSRFYNFNVFQNSIIHIIECISWKIKYILMKLQIPQKAENTLSIGWNVSFSALYHVRLVSYLGTYLVNYIDRLVGSDTSNLKIPMALLTYITGVMVWVFGRDNDCPDWCFRSGNWLSWLMFSVRKLTVLTGVFVFPQFLQVNAKLFLPHCIFRCYRLS
jgi:hypothetical protein